MFQSCSTNVPRNPVNPMQQQFCHFETKTVMASLGVSLTTLRRAVVLLREVLGSDFDKNLNERGYSMEACKALTLYFNYRNQGANRERAAQYVKKTLTQQES